MIFLCSFRLRPLATLAAVLLTVLASCNRRDPGFFQGYIEAEYLYAVSPRSGVLAELAVRRGDSVAKNQLLFALETEPEESAVRQSEHRAAQAEARRDNLLKGKRAVEVAAFEARQAQARSALELAKADLGRREGIAASSPGAISVEQLDQARARLDSARAQAEVAEAELASARLGARDDEIRAAEAEVGAANSVLAEARWALGQKRQHAPAAATVHDTLFLEGEWVPAARPVVVILPPDSIKVRFFVPEEHLPRVQAGARVRVDIDSAPSRLATIGYVSTEPEYTPPVIYSRTVRAKLVFMVEAHFDVETARDLRPGQPADVRIEGEPSQVPEAP